MMHKVRSVTTDYYLKNKRDGISGREDGATLNLEVKSLNWDLNERQGWGCPVNICMYRVPGRQDRQHQGPEAGTSLASWRYLNKVQATEA